MRCLHALTAFLFLGSVTGPAVLIAPEPALAQSSSAGCAGKAEPATAPAPNTGDGTAPGNAGSTGWTGGTGGAHIGTNPSGAVASSPTEHPPTARGLDLAMEAEPAPAPAATPGNC